MADCIKHGLSELEILNGAVFSFYVHHGVACPVQFYHGIGVYMCLVQVYDVKAGLSNRVFA